MIQHYSSHAVELLKHYFSISIFFWETGPCGEAASAHAG
jgi:hypothetical protein